MNILITGGAGYIGGALTDILLKTKHNIRVYDSLMYEDDYLKDVPFVLGDIRNRSHLKKQLQWADAVIWLAALVGDGACALNPDISAEINQESVKWLADNYDGRIIFTSTCSVYGVHRGILTEDSPVGPLSVYGITKLAAEGFLKNKNAIVFRLGTLFGVGDRYSRLRLDLVVNTLTSRAVIDHTLTLFGVKQYRPLLHVRDAAETIAENIETKHSGIFNLHRQNSTMLDLAKTVVRLVPATTIKMSKMNPSDMRNYSVSSERAASTLGFRPKRTVEDGIRELTQLFAERRIRNIHSVKYTNEGQLTARSSHKLVDQNQAVNSAPPEKPSIIEGNMSIDDRGRVAFVNPVTPLHKGQGISVLDEEFSFFSSGVRSNGVNGFDLKEVKRFYQVSNHHAGFVRAWHGHKKEAKYIWVSRGSALVGVVRITNWKKPSRRTKVERFVLSADSPRILCIPAGYAHGWMSLTQDSTVLFFSTATLAESTSDDFRFPARYWDIWKVEER